MNTYVITFQALNTKKEKITCSAFVHSETLFLAVQSEVINEVINWKNFAYTLKELEEAKNEAIKELRS